ncbi:MAG: leucine-rich repeat domain-containing protein, partial [Fibrobacter sp.]|nr:leucine-rich repeat domain-containing protein [Fibrobacter sp.]
NDMDSPLILSIKKQVGKVVSKKKILTSLNLSDKKIRYLPDYLFGLDTITKLDLSENKLSSIPDDIEKLVNIKELSVSENNLQTLPSSICKLKALTVLDVSCNQMGMDNGSFLFPECIGQLINLTVLYGDYNKCFPLPESFSNLTALQTLSLFQCSDETPVDFPIQITALSNLRTLNIGSNSFREIPAAIANLTNLKYINLSSSLCYLKSVPDLSALKSLTILDASGARNFSGRPDPDPSIIASFFTAPNLVELNISGFKNKLEAGHLEGIGNLKKLEILDISSNNITKFPGEIFTLSSLKKLRAVNANIDRREIVKLTEFIPDIKIET